MKNKYIHIIVIFIAICLVTGIVLKIKISKINNDSQTKNENINVNEIVEFYVKIKTKNLKKAVTTDEIRKYAEETVGMEKVMLPIISFIESEE